MAGSVWDNPSLRLSVPAPKMAGMESKNEYLAAVSRSMPSSRPMLIVEPDLEIPGIMANPCTIPIINAFVLEKPSITDPLPPGLARRVSHKSNPVTISIRPVKNDDENS